MEMTGEYRIAAPRATVWDGLNDPDILRQCIPGCETLTRVSPDELAATVTAKLGPVKANFAGQVHLSNINAPESYTISGEGKGGAAGFAKGSADVALVEYGTDTVLRYKVNASIGGKMAQLGARLIDGTAKKMAEEFFAKFASLMAAQAAPSAPPVEPPAVEPPAVEPPLAATAPSVGPAPPQAVPAPPPIVAPASVREAPPPEPKAPPPYAPPPSRGLSPAIWVIGLIIVVAILVYAFS
jgi:carbon monoxide dehydrogenase subunit G